VSNSVPTPANQANPILAEHADAIRELHKRVAGDVIEIGRLLTECKRICGHGNWLPWLDREFRWTDDTALNFMRVYELSRKSRNFRDLSLPISALYLLAAPSTPETARAECFKRAGAGEVIQFSEVKRVVEKHKNDTKGHKQPAKRVYTPAMHRPSKLGEDVVATLRGTSLDSAAEMDALVELNRGAAEGELTAIARGLIFAAVTGNDVSAIEIVRLGARNEELEQTALEQLEAAWGKCSGQERSAFMARHGPAESHRLARENLALRSEVDELRAKPDNRIVASPNRGCVGHAPAEHALVDDGLGIPASPRRAAPAPATERGSG
jgi:hypothetical protein